jgi:hypothetical protein
MKWALVCALAAVTACVIAIGAAAVAASPPSASAETRSNANRLAGTWVATVVRPAPLPPLRSLQIITPEGTAIETSNEPPANRSPMFSSWERIEGRHYAITGLHFLFNPQTGEFLGTRKINRTIELSQDGQSFKAVARVTTFDPNGNVVGQGVAMGSAERLTVEPIADRP